MTTVRLEREGAMAHVVLDRPAQLNAISPELLRDLDAACTAIEEKSGAASRTVKRLVDRGLDLDLSTGLELEKHQVAAHMRTDDAIAGLRAFRERARRKAQPQDAGGAGAPPSEARITKETS